MNEESAAVLHQIKRDIHGAAIHVPPKCDYCGGPAAATGRVQYEVLRLGDLKAVERLFDHLSMWLLDALRCEHCIIEAIDPATDGYDEALVWVSFVETNRQLTVDASAVELIDFSPHPEGYYPPKTNPVLMLQYSDPGLARWMRLQRLIERNHDTPELLEQFEPYIPNGREIPPEVSELLG